MPKNGTKKRRATRSPKRKTVPRSKRKAAAKRKAPAKQKAPPVPTIPRMGFFLRIPKDLNDKLLQRQLRESEKAGHQVSKNALIVSILERNVR